LPSLLINREEILWSDRLKYLYVLFISGKNLTLDIVPVLRQTIWCILALTFDIWW